MKSWKPQGIVTNFQTVSEWQRVYGEGYESWRQSRWKDSPRETKEFLEHAVPLGHISNRLTLMHHQAEALQRIIYSHERCDLNPLLVTLATGTGKTVVMASVMAWLACRYPDIQTFLLLCPNTIVRDRLKRDYEGGKIFKEFDLFPESKKELHRILRCTIVERFENLQNLMGSKVLVSNRHQFQKGYKGGRDHLVFLQREGGTLAIFNDEAHNTRSDEYESTLSILGPQTQFRLDVTATPDRADELRPESHEIYELPVLEAITQRLIKDVVIQRPNPSIYKAMDFNFTNEETGEKYKISEIPWDDIRKLRDLKLVIDPGPMKLQLQLAVEALNLKKAIAKGRYKPLLFVIGPSIECAKRIVKMMKEEFGFNPLLVVDDESAYEKKDLRKQAANLGQMASPHDSVVSVYMLREGWDVPEVSVMCLLRGFGSPLFARQVLGRGLRIIRNIDFGEDTSAVQELIVIDHPVLGLDDLWAEIDACIKEGELVVRGHEMTREPAEPGEEKQVVEEQTLERPALLELLKLPDVQPVGMFSTALAMSWLDEALTQLKDYEPDAKRLFVGETIEGTTTIATGQRSSVTKSPKTVMAGPWDPLSRENVQNALQEDIMKWADELANQYEPFHGQTNYLYSKLLIEGVEKYLLNNLSVTAAEPESLYLAQQSLVNIKESVMYELNHRFYTQKVMNG